MMKYPTIFALPLVMLAGSAMLTAAEEKIDFNRDIRPLISSNCIACHGPDENERAADLRLDTIEGSRADLGGYAAIVPGDAEASEMLYRITTDDEDDKMPPKGKGRRLDPDEIALIRRWIEQGGEYAKHWSYEKPILPKIPAVPPSWPVSNPIDAFVYQRLEEEGLTPSAQADRWTLARRVALDLTGLPPTWEEASAFVQDTGDDAYERYVDAQLAKPAFGERWARVWLDLARYADSAGYADDPPRTIWAYRDWVIRALNDDMPFDRFTIEQIAGDLLESPTEDQLVATAFHRNTLTNNEGGTNNEEFRTVAVVDRVNTTMEVWMGTTMACAQCHTHKFDPITHDEYFQMYDFFNQSEDSDQRDERPLLEIWSDEQLEQKRSWTERITTLKQVLDTNTPVLEEEKKNWLAGLRQEPAWKPLTNAKLEGSNLEQASDGTGWLSLGKKESTVTDHVLSFPTSQQTISGLELEVSPEQTANFVLSQLSAEWTPKVPTPTVGQYVRIELPGKSKMIHLAELQVFSGGKNVAPTGTATQSSTDYDGPAQLAIDGNTDGDYAKKSVSHTAAESDPWFELDLGKPMPIDRLLLWNRTGKGLPERLKGFRIQVLDASRNAVWEDSPEIPNPSSTYSFSGSRPLKFRSAHADFSQTGFPAQSVISPKLDPKKGWAIGGQTGKDHRLKLILGKPMNLEEGTLTLRLNQRYSKGQHVLTNFRFSITNDPDITQWAQIPTAVREAIKATAPSEAQLESIRVFHRSIATSLHPERQELAKLTQQLASLKPNTTVPVMRDLSGTPRVTKLQIRGNYKNTAHQLSAATPAVFHPLREDLPRNRLALAHWLVDPENPLTSRVMVNRFWAQIFGQGIVATNEEFGSQGELPSHPELLDWLAIQFGESWDLKHLLKLMVLSLTYQQSSVVTPELENSDPFNILYARGPRFRISAEMVRDQSLFLSGLLSDKMFGPPVKPPQPELGLKAAFGSATDWKTSQGEDRYRRGIYTTWRRSSPYPSMAAFDAPNREVCTSRRGRTNTPLQALVTMNDPVYIEAAQALARQIYAGSDTTETRVEHGLTKCLLRQPTAIEIQRLTDLFNTSRDRFRSSPEMALEMATNPLGPLPEGYPPADLAAWTVVANVILNLDEIFLKR
tara:strand:- start:23005 stop:26415 length:3411 start_codon:yes stop_codon:yes gene_type:complete